jgi:hypothetical protein
MLSFVSLCEFGLRTIKFRRASKHVKAHRVRQMWKSHYNCDYSFPTALLLHQTVNSKTIGEVRIFVIIGSWEEVDGNYKYSISSVAADSTYEIISRGEVGI